MIESLRVKQVLPITAKWWWQNERGLADWSHKYPARTNASPSRSTAEGYDRANKKRL